MNHRYVSSTSFILVHFEVTKYSNYKLCFAGSTVKANSLLLNAISIVQSQIYWKT